MSPLTHLLASWIVAAKTTNNPRDCRLVTLAGILPDLDGAGIIVDLAHNLSGRGSSQYYGAYHHFLLHGGLGALAIAGLMACFARERWRVAMLALIVFHLHLLCDLAGSRGPSPEDLWPIYYFGPLSYHPVWIWKGQWRLDGWINRCLTAALLLWALWLAAAIGHSIVGVFNRRLDGVVVPILKKWRAQLATERVMM